MFIVALVPPFVKTPYADVFAASIDTSIVPLISAVKLAVFAVVSFRVRLFVVTPSITNVEPLATEIAPVAAVLTVNVALPDVFGFIVTFVFPLSCILPIV